MRKAEVLIIGRANVGKSGLFNALVGRRQALISKIPGTTRDANFAGMSWKEARFTLGDSAGLEHMKIFRTVDMSKYRNIESAPLEHLIEFKTIDHLKEASVRILVVDAETGLMPQDREIMKYLRGLGLSFILAVNKVDGKNDEPKAEEFLKLHITPTFLVSSITRKGVGDLLDYISSELSSPTVIGDSKTKNKKQKDQNVISSEAEGGVEKSQTVRNDSMMRSLDYARDDKKKTIRAAIIGRTNVGKSTLTNSLTESSEMIVSATPHTTREPHATTIPLDDTYDIELIDTAGVRKKAKIDHFLEIVGVRMSLEKLKSTDVILFVVDLADNLGSQDLALARLVAEHRRSCIIIGNKFDLVKRQMTNEKRQINKSLRGFAKQSSEVVIPDFDPPASPSLGGESKKKKQKDLHSSYENYIRKSLPKLNYAPVVLISAESGTNVPALKPLIKQVYENTFKIFPEHDVNVVLQKSLKLQPPPIVGEKKRKVQVQGLYQNSKNPKEYILKVYTRDYTPPNFVKFIEKQLRSSLPLEGVPTYITVENTREG